MDRMERNKPFVARKDFAWSKYEVDFSGISESFHNNTNQETYLRCFGLALLRSQEMRYDADFSNLKKSVRQY